MAATPLSKFHSDPAKAVPVKLSDVYTDDRAGSLMELIGEKIHIHRIELFDSAQYEARGFRLVVRIQHGDGDESADLLFTGFGKSVLRIVDSLMPSSDHLLYDLPNPISCEVVAQGRGYAIK